MTASRARSLVAGVALLAAVLVLGMEFLVPPVVEHVAASALTPQFGEGADVQVHFRGPGLALLQGRVDEVELDVRRAVVGGIPVSELHGAFYDVRLEPLALWRQDRPAVRSVARSQATFRISQDDIARWMAERAAHLRAAGRDGWLANPSVTIGDGWIEVRGEAHYLGTTFPVEARGRIVPRAQEGAVSFAFDKLTVGGHGVPAALANAVFDLIGGGARLSFSLAGMPLQVTGVELAGGWATIRAAGGAWAPPEPALTSRRVSL